MATSLPLAPTGAAVPGSAAAPPGSTAATLAERAEAVEQALADVQGMPIDHRTRALALKTALEAFHKDALITIVRALKADPRGKELLLELVDDPGVYTLFAMHGIVKADVRTRVAAAIEQLRPYTQSHGGDVTLVDVQGDTLFVRLSGACNGCSMSSVTLRNGLEESLKAQVPEITRIEVVPNEPAGPALVPLQRASPNDGWIAGPEADAVIDGAPYRFELADGRSVVLLRLDDELRAWWNACAHLGLPIDGGRIDREAGTITCPWHGFRFDCATGECLSAPQAQLEGVPLRVVNGRVQLRPGA